MHCGRFTSPTTRRDMLARCANGFGALALSALLRDRAFGADAAGVGLHHPPKARNVIFLYMDGGPSQVPAQDLAFRTWVQ